MCVQTKIYLRKIFSYVSTQADTFIALLHKSLRHSVIIFNHRNNFFFCISRIFICITSELYIDSVKRNYGQSYKTSSTVFRAWED